MDDSVKVILKKLDDIDFRLKNLEGVGKQSENGLTLQKEKAGRDPLFHKAVEEMDKVNEISVKTLSQALKIDEKRASLIMDQMEASGLGTCYMKET